MISISFKKALPIALVLCCSFAFSSEQDIKKSDLPSIVRSAFEKAYPNAKIEEVEKEVLEGKTFFNIEAKNIIGSSKDIEFEAIYTPEGILYETRIEISTDKLPAALRKAMAAKYPGAKIEDAELRTRGAVTEYAFEIKTNKVELKFLTDANGDLIKPVEKKDDK